MRRRRLDALSDSRVGVPVVLLNVMDSLLSDDVLGDEIVLTRAVISHFTSVKRELKLLCIIVSVLYESLSNNTSVDEDILTIDLCVIRIQSNIGNIPTSNLTQVETLERNKKQIYPRLGVA